MEIMKRHGTSSASHFDNAAKPLKQGRREAYMKAKKSSSKQGHARAGQALDGTSTVYRESIPLSDDGKARAQPKDNEELLNIYLPALLIADEGTYRMISDDDLLKYMKGALHRFRYLQVSRAIAYCATGEDERIESYTREMRRCNQVICRIQLELTRRIIAQVGEESSE